MGRDEEFRRIRATVKIKVLGNEGLGSFDGRKSLETSQKTDQSTVTRLKCLYTAGRVPYNAQSHRETNIPP
jgi:hypothetical protein